MAGIIILEDGSDLYASNIGLRGAFECIAEAIVDTDPPLACWLLDLAQRGGGMMDFDLRGLAYPSRAAFWSGVEQAHARFADWDQAAAFSPTVGTVRMFYEKRHAQHAAVTAGIASVDLDDIWFDDPGG